jgi:hypothetical protein
MAFRADDPAFDRQWGKNGGEREFPPDMKDTLSDWRGCREDILDEFDKAVPRPARSPVKRTSARPR